MNQFPHFPSRTVVNLDGTWEFAFAENKQLEVFSGADFTADGIMQVPACFDTLPDYYCKRGTAFYRREFVLDAAAPRAVLKLGGLGLRARFWLDGKEIGFTNLPYSGVEFPINRALAAGRHVLTAAIDNTFDEQKMKLFHPYYDFYAYGGFYRGVELHVLPKDYALQRVQVRTLDHRTGKVALRFLFNGKTPATVKAAVKFDTDKKPRALALAVKDGAAEWEGAVPDFKPWTPAKPCLHTVDAAMDNGDRVIERFGIREIAVRGKKILLNGKNLYLKGFNRHDAYPQSGAATPETVMLEDLQNLRRLGCNFLRGAHYPQSQRFLDLCDEFGMLVWEESLGWGNFANHLEDPEFCALQEEQTRLMVRNSVNHPAVIIWGFLNECDSGHESGRALIERLAKAVKEEDASRLVTFACNHNGNDLGNAHTDIVAFNTYPGWCDNDSSRDPIGKIAPDVKQIVKFYQNKFPEGKPIMVSEMGTCGIYGARDGAGAQWTEDFQAEYLGELSRAVLANPEICGLTIWQFNDAKSYLRFGASPRCKPLAQNLAGVFDAYRRPKKAAETMRAMFKDYKK